jgi:hypothetical protein
MWNINISVKIKYALGDFISFRYQLEYVLIQFQRFGIQWLCFRRTWVVQPDYKWSGGQLEYNKEDRNSIPLSIYSLGTFWMSSQMTRSTHPPYRTTCVSITVSLKPNLHDKKLFYSSLNYSVFRSLSVIGQYLGPSKWAPREKSVNCFHQKKVRIIVIKFQ